MFAIWFFHGSEIYSFNLLQNVHVRISLYRNRKPFCVNPQVIIEKLFPTTERKSLTVDSCQTTETIWSVTSFKLFIVHVHGYILMTIGSGFLFWNQNFCLQIKNNRKSQQLFIITENDSTVCYFNKVRYLFGMNNQLTLPRTEKLFYFKITSSQ